MKVISLALSLLSMSAFSFDYINSFADSRYEGEGYWTDSEGDYADYETYIEFSANNLRADYVWHEGDSTIDLQFLFDEEGFFEVAYDGYIVGEGSCLKYHCEYEMNFDGAYYHERLTFLEGMLHKVGKKELYGITVIWEERLFLVGVGVPVIEVPVYVPVEELNP